VHNDIKPSNIAYSPRRGAVLLDFGLATRRSDAASRCGSPWYVPPEFRTEHTRGVAGDIWALGVTMLYVLRKTGLPERSIAEWFIWDVNLDGSEAGRRMAKWLETVARPRETLNHADAVEQLVYRMLDPEPTSRIRAKHIVSEFDRF
jgi:serine/threonine protein kinase